MGLRAGILAVQGDVEAHRRVLEALGAEVRCVRRASELDGLDALVLPGGESTTISKGLERLGLYEPLEDFAAAGKRVLGTCAGAVLLAREVENHSVRSLGLVDVRAVRNAYGTQVDSFAAPAEDPAPGFEGLECVFIRAPRLCDAGSRVRSRGAGLQCRFACLDRGGAGADLLACAQERGRDAGRSREHSASHRRDRAALQVTGACGVGSLRL